MLLPLQHLKLSIQQIFKAWGRGEEKNPKLAMLDISDIERRLFYNLVKGFWI